MKINKFMVCALIGAATIFSPHSVFAVSKHRKKTSVVRVKPPRPFESLVAQYAKHYKLPVNLVHAVIRTESNYKVNAHGKAGEIGLMQLMPSTARELGFKGPLTELYKPSINLKYGIKYLAKAHQLGKGNTCRTILKYNAGFNAKKVNPVSKHYCKKVKKYLFSVRKVHYDKFGI